jgi:hypothetical protein
MKPMTILSLSAAVLLDLGTSVSLAGDRPDAQCIKLLPIVGELGPMVPQAPALHTWQLTGTLAHEVAYVESRDRHGERTLDPIPKQIFLSPTTSGHYLVRVVDVPAGHGWYGPF